MLEVARYLQARKEKQLRVDTLCTIITGAYTFGSISLLTIRPFMVETRVQLTLHIIDF